MCLMILIMCVTLSVLISNQLCAWWKLILRSRFVYRSTKHVEAIFLWFKKFFACRLSLEKCWNIFRSLLNVFYKSKSRNFNMWRMICYWLLYFKVNKIFDVCILTRIENLLSHDNLMMLSYYPFILIIKLPCSCKVTVKKFKIRFGSTILQNNEMISLIQLAKKFFYIFNKYNENNRIWLVK